MPDPKRPGYYGGPEAPVDPRTYGKMHGLDFDETSAIKYITRWRKPGGRGVKDLEKAKHYIELIISELPAEGSCVSAEGAVECSNIGV